MTHDITVCVPTIPPRAGFLLRALESVVAQTLPPAAVAVAVDSAGEGAATTRNRAIDMASTEWIAFLDDDDTMYPQHLARLAAHQEATGADLVYSWFDLNRLGEIRNDCDPLGMFGKSFDLADLDKFNWIPVTFLVRRELVVEVGGYPHLESERWPHDDCEDWGFNRDLRDAGAAFAHLPERTWVWNHHGLNTSGKPWTKAA